MDLLFAFCQELGLTSVVLVGHSDGGLLALMAAAKALKSRDSVQVCSKSLRRIYFFLSTSFAVIYAIILEFRGDISTN